MTVPAGSAASAAFSAGRLTYYGGQAKVQQLRLPSLYLRWETALGRRHAAVRRADRPSWAGHPHVAPALRPSE